MALFGNVIVATAFLPCPAVSVSNVSWTVEPAGNSSVCPPSLTWINVLFSSSVNFSNWSKLITGRTVKL